MQDQAGHISHLHSTKSESNDMTSCQLNVSHMVSAELLAFLSISSAKLKVAEFADFY